MKKRFNVIASEIAVHDDETHIEKVQLPLSEKGISFSAGGGTDGKVLANRKKISIKANARNAKRGGNEIIQNVEQTCGKGNPSQSNLTLGESDNNVGVELSANSDCSHPSFISEAARLAMQARREP